MHKQTRSDLRKIDEMDNIVHLARYADSIVEAQNINEHTPSAKICKLTYVPPSPFSSLPRGTIERERR